MSSSTSSSTSTSSSAAAAALSMQLSRNSQSMAYRAGATTKASRAPGSRVRGHDTIEAVLALAEASQARERIAVAKCRAVRNQAQRESKIVRARSHAARVQLKARETSFAEEMSARTQALEAENEALRTALAKSESHGHNLRQRVTQLLRAQAHIQRPWHTRVAELEESVRTLIDSTNEALQNAQAKHALLSPKSCTACAEKSDAIHKLRKDLAVAQKSLQARLANHSDVVAKLDAGCKTLEGALSRSLELLFPATSHDSTDFALRGITSVDELRGVLEAERAAMARLQARYSHEQETWREERMAWQEERMAWRKRLQAWRGEIETKHSRNNSPILTESHYTLKEDDLVTHRTAINEDLATKSDVAALKTVRNQVVDMTAALSQPKEALGAHHILLTELQVLRSAESARLEDMNSMNKESYWLRQERNAVAQGLARQQACVQEQLKVLRHLRDAFQEVNAERAALNDQAAEIFDDIKHSFLDEVEARQLDTDLPLIAPEDNSDVDSDNDREQEHGE